MEEKSFYHLKKFIFYFMTGVFLYPFLTFLSHFVLGILLSHKPNEMDTTISVFLVCVPLFSMFFLFASFSMLKIEFRFRGEKFVRKSYFYFTIVFVLLTITLPLKVIFKDVEIFNNIEFFRTIAWRIFILFSFVLGSIMFYQLRAVKLAGFSLIISSLSLIDDIIFYYMKILSLQDSQYKILHLRPTIILNFIVFIFAFWLMRKLYLTAHVLFEVTNHEILENIDRIKEKVFHRMDDGKINPGD